MKLTDNIIAFFTGKKEKEKAPEGLCPNCWGRQDYEGHFFDAIQHEEIDLNNIIQKRGWIQAYAMKHLEGIKLKEKEDFLECANCSITYKSMD